MKRILANDGLHPAGVARLEEAGFHVDLNHIPQEDLLERLPAYDGIVVRSATKVRQDLIEACPNLKVIGRGGVGMDNIDVQYARDKGLGVYNTPAASSRSVAELVVGHMFTLARSLHLSNRQMPGRGQEEFKVLKKSYSKGAELGGKTLGIIGFGRIGQTLASIAYGMGMHVLPVDPYINEATVKLDFPGGQPSSVEIKVATVDKSEMLPKADYISVHVPFSDGVPLIGAEEIHVMKSTACIINTARGGVVDESALLSALDEGRLAGAGLDVFVGEPKPDPRLLAHPMISLTPHTGASTTEAQRNIGLEIADQFIEHFA